MISKYFEIYCRSIMHFALLGIFRYSNIYIYYIYLYSLDISKTGGVWHSPNPQRLYKAPMQRRGPDGPVGIRYLFIQGQRSDCKDPKVKSQAPGNWGRGMARLVPRDENGNFTRKKLGFQETHWYKWGPQLRVKVAKVQIHIRLKQKELGSNI